MLIWTTLKIALNSLAVNKLRSILTMLGVIIGVGAVIAMLSLGTAFGDLISSQITMMGTNVLFVRAGSTGRHGPPTMAQTLRPEDAEALLTIKGVKAVTPMVFGGGNFKAGNRSSNTATVQGVAPSLLSMQNIQIERGRMFTDHDVRRSARVCVLGPKLAGDLFEDQDPIGKTIRLGRIPLRVIGVTKALGDQMGFNPDDRAFVPYTTAMKQIPPRREFISNMMIEAVDKESLGSITEDVKKVLRKRHHLRPDEDDDFAIQSSVEILDTLGKITLYLTMFLGTVAAISLVVGGIGIMNIMLATVAERTREIGIRKAIGAKDRDILRQFLIEALVITLGGGFIGLLLGWGLMAATAFALKQWLSLSPILQWWVVGMSIAISTAVGLTSGLYPAWRASRLDPVTALRYE